MENNKSMTYGNPLTDLMWPEEKYESARELGPHVCNRTEFVQRTFDKKWVRWELVDSTWERQEGEYPFASSGPRYVWIATGVWHDRPDTAMKESKDGYRKRIT